MMGEKSHKARVAALERAGHAENFTDGARVALCGQRAASGSVPTFRRVCWRSGIGVIERAHPLRNRYQS